MRSGFAFVEWLIAVALAVTLGGCDTSRAIEAAKTVGPAGGSLELEGGATLVIPGGALAKEEQITAKQLPDSELPPEGIAGTAFELGPDGLSFQQPVQVTVSYEAANLKQPDTSLLRIVQILPGGKLGFTQLVFHDAEKRLVTANLFHFSRYCLADLKSSTAMVKVDQKPLKDVDVLFMIDNSNSMEQEQQNLIANFPKLISKLDGFGFDYRVGIVSADLGAGSYSLPSCEVKDGDGGKLLNKPRVPGCTPPTDPWIEKIGGKTNVPGGDVSAAFSCIAALGTGGCGFEAQLESVHRALEPATNPGFVRQNAGLAIVYITDEDDCSAEDTTLFDPVQQGLSDPLGPLTSFRCFEFGITCDVNGRTPGVRKSCAPGGKHLFPISRYVSQLRALKPAGQVLVSAIAAPTEPVEVAVEGLNPMLKASCQSVNGAGVPPIRIASLLAEFGTSSLTSICETDFGPALTKLGDLVASTISLAWCLPYDPIDVNPLTPAREDDCVVVGSKIGRLQACQSGATTPCYRIVEGKLCAQSKSVLRIENTAPASLGDDVYAICLVGG